MLLTSCNDACSITLMRTTVTLDDDLIALLQNEAKAQHSSFKEVLNYTLRFGLTAKRAAAEASRNAPKVAVRPFSGGLLPGYDPDRMNQLCDELEVEEFINKDRKLNPHP